MSYRVMLNTHSAQPSECRREDINRPLSELNILTSGKEENCEKPEFTLVNEDFEQFSDASRRQKMILGKRSNRLVDSKNPYLLQHAHNPIAWYPWSAEALTKAKQEDKPVLLSIGYAACHWCHVMARESFEDPQVAAIMNQYFVCIKVDREERPDIDQVYVEAVQAMGLQAGWPLHVFLLPNQQPFYGGTYFPNAAWKELLTQIAAAFQQHRPQLEASATQFTQALISNIRHSAPADYHSPYEPNKDRLHSEKGKGHSRASLATLQHIFQALYQNLDPTWGGVQGAPKFPMPSVGAFLLNYYRLTQDQRALGQLTLTLTKMACGGIYDQLGGGFARYATDEAWLIPHFEKMLYDNAQLISLYAQAYLVAPHKLYKEVIEQTIACLEREMMDPQGGFYSSMDADSEGVEGKFYTWTPQEVAHVLGGDVAWFVEYYPMVPYTQAVIARERSDRGNLSVDITQRSHEAQRTYLFTRNPHFPPTEAQAAKLQAAKQALFDSRAKRIKPPIDNKILTSWNGMMLQALIDAYYALGTAHYLELACEHAAWLLSDRKTSLRAEGAAVLPLQMKDYQLSHSYYQGQLGGSSYLEDYAWLARALISLYQATFEETWLAQAASLIDYAIQHFWDEAAHLFYATAADAEQLITRPREVFDQAIPSSNAVMAHNLFYLSILLDREDYAIKAQQMVDSIIPLLVPGATPGTWETPLYLTHWASLYALQLQEVITVAIVGPQCKAWAYEIKKRYPAVLLVGTATESKLPLLKDKTAYLAQEENVHASSQSSIYICYDKTCQLPVQSLEEALVQLGARSKPLPNAIPAHRHCEGTK